MKTYTPNFFFINFFFLKIGGYWPPEDKLTLRYKFYKMYQGLVLLVSIIYGPFATIKSLVDYSHVVTIVIDVLNVGFTMILSSGKIIFWLTNCERLKSIMVRLETSEFTYQKVEDFDPELMLNKAKETGKKYSLLLWFFCQGTLFFGFAPATMMSSWYYINNMPITNITMFEKLPVYQYVPFKHDTALTYFFACLTQLIPMHIYVNIIVGVDGLFMNLLHLIGTHMLILKEAFKTMRKVCLSQITEDVLAPDGLYNSRQLEEQMIIEMKKCIKHLQMLYRSCQETENIFKYMSLFQTLSTLYLLCSTLFLLSTISVLASDFIKYTLYLVGQVMQLGLYCWSGNELMIKAKNLSEGLWESDWLETTKSYKVCMLITMMKLRIPLHFTAGNFMPLILGTYISVLKASYSFYTVLKGMKK